MFAEGSRIFERTAIGVREAGARLTSPELGRVRQAAGRTLGAPASLRLIGQPWLPQGFRPSRGATKARTRAAQADRWPGAAGA